MCVFEIELNHDALGSLLLAWVINVACSWYQIERFRTRAMCAFEPPKPLMKRDKIPEIIGEEAEFQL